LGSGDGGQVTVKADRLLISSGKVAEFPSVIASSAEPGSSGRAGSVAVTAGELELHDGGLIASSTFGPGDGGQVTIQADRLLVAGDGATNLTGIASSAEAGSTGAGGMVNIQAQNVVLRDHGAVTTESDGAGPGGPLSITATDTLRLDNASVQAQTALGDVNDSFHEFTHRREEAQSIDFSQLSEKQFFVVTVDRHPVFPFWTAFLPTTKPEKSIAEKKAAPGVFQRRFKPVERGYAGTPS
jgi:hypothetical protein